VCRWRLDTSAGDDHSSSPGGNRAVSNSESAVVTPYRSARRFRHAYNCVPVRSPAGSPSGRTRSRSPRWRDGPRVGSGRRRRRRRACRVGAGCSAVLVVRRRRRDPDVGGAPAFELVDDRLERLLARERDVARYDSRSSAGVRGYPAGQCSSGRALFSRVHPSPHVGLRRVRRARRRPLRALPCSTSRPSRSRMYWRLYPVSSAANGAVTRPSRSRSRSLSSAGEIILVEHSPVGCRAHGLSYGRI